jgi:ABC-2 type transport system permease protein
MTDVETGGRRPLPIPVITGAGPLILAFLRRDWKIAISYKLDFATQLVTTVLSLSFVYFLGRLVGSTQSLHIGRYRALHLGYFPFAVIGIGLLGLVSTELQAVSGQIRADQTTGTLEALLAMPPPAWLTVLGSVSYQLAYAAAAAALTVVFAVVGFGMRFDTTLASGAMAAAGAAVSLALFLSFGVGFASAVVVFKRGGQVAGFVITGFSLLGGVYYPTSLLGSPLRYVSDVLPFTWALNVIRAGLLERQVEWTQFGLLTVASVVCVPVSLAVFNWSVTRARRAGTLGQY